MADIDEIDLRLKRVHFCPRRVFRLTQQLEEYRSKFCPPKI